MRNALWAFGPSGLMAVLCLATNSSAFTEAEEETRLLAVWNGAELEITPFESFDVYLKLRVQHGDDDFFVEDGPHRVTGDQTSVLEVPWPDLSHKGELAAAPATVTGWVRVVALDGQGRGLVGVEPRLWFADEPDMTFAQDELASLTGLVVEEGLALAGAAPEAVVAVGVTP